MVDVDELRQLHSTLVGRNVLLYCTVLYCTVLYPYLKAYHASLTKGNR